jgi:dihydrofolate reductase
MISLIVAVSENGVIGRDGDMPWRLPSDLKRFKQVTVGKPVIMGRKTFQSIGRPLPGRANILVTRSQDYRPDGVVCMPDLEEAIAFAAKIASESGETEIFVIGGGEIYRQALPRADRVYFTQVHMTVDGDTTFPELDKLEWRETSRCRHEASEHDSVDYSFVVFERV